MVALFWNTSIGCVIRCGGAHNLEISSSIPVRLLPKRTSSNPKCIKWGKRGHFKQKAVHHLVGPVRLGCAWHLHRRWKGQPGAASKCKQLDVLMLCFFLGAVAKLFVAGALPWRRRQLQGQGKGRPDRGLSAVCSPRGDDLVGHGVFVSLRCWLLPIDGSTI